MPLYQYCCEKCSTVIEEIKKMDDRYTLPTCPKCKKRMKFDMAGNAPSFKFNCDMSHTGSEGKPTISQGKYGNYKMGRYKETIQKKKQDFIDKKKKEAAAHVLKGGKVK